MFYPLSIFALLHGVALSSANNNTNNPTPPPHHYTLSSPNVKLELTVPSQSNASVFISSLTLKAATGQTANLIVENNTAPSAGYGSLTQTALRTADGLILQPFLGTNTSIVQQTSTSELHLTSLELRTNTSSTVYGHEDWSLRLDTDDTKGYGFVWSVNRTFAIDTHVVTDRQALVFSTIKYGAQTHGILGSQVPSVLDLNMVMNNTNTNNNAPGCLTTPTKPGTCGPSGFPSVNVGYPFNYQFVSPNLSQHVLLTPSGLEIDIDYSTNSSSTSKTSFYEKKTADGTSPFVTLGASTTSWLDTEPTVVRSAGSNQSTTLTLRITKVQSSGSPYSSLNISFPKHLTSLEHSIQTFVRVQHQWMGWIFGNNPASTPCLHEMSWFGLIQQMFDVGSISHKAIAKEMAFFSNTAVNGSGYVYPRWNSGGYYNVVWGPLIDQNPHFVLAMHSVVSITGNYTWLHSVEKSLDLVSQYMLDRGLNSTKEKTPNVVPGAVYPGIFTTISSGLSDGKRHATNWYDIIDFGGADALVSLYSILAMKAMAEMKSMLGKNTDAQEYMRIYDNAVLAFTTSFWDETKGYFADWIDVDGKKRFYMYADIQHLAIAHQIASKSQAERIMANIKERYNDICLAFEITKDDIWATPSCFNPIPKEYENDTVLGHWGTPSAAGVKEWGSMPSYEIGGSFFHSVGFEYLALGEIDQADAALSLFQNFMKNVEKNRGWAQQLYWGSSTGKRKEELVGFDPLNNSLIALWGFLQTVFGVRISLLKGVEFVGKASREMEGGTWTFSHLGERVCVVVKGGKGGLC